MALTPRLDLRQSQSLVMTPQLQQAIRLLTLSNIELEAALTEELASNPLLESGRASAEERAGPAPDDSAMATDRLIATGVAGASDTLDADYGADTFHHDSVSDSQWEGAAAQAAAPEPTLAEQVAAGPDGPGGSAVDSQSGGDGDAIDFDSFSGTADSLYDHLCGQAGAALSGDDYHIALILIEAIDDAGYIDIDMTGLATRLDLPRARIEAILDIIQHFDPVGVGARSLSDCLAIQAREADRYDPMMARLIDNLDLLARGQIPQLRRMCNADEEDMADMIRELRSYDPKPGLRFSTSSAAPVIPDIFVRRTAAGWMVEINSDTLPRLLINRQYYAELSSVATKGPQKAWLSDCMASANWLMKALDQRQQTIIKVSQEIVKQQEGFFLNGVSALIPLTLRQVADAVDLHESTVSRVTSNKYLSCSRGLFELKYFFSSGIAGADGETGMSAEAIKNRIKQLIDAEDGDAILSDDTLVEMLVKEGCPIARRTVAKYREAMGIGSSVQRRRAKAMGR